MSFPISYEIIYSKRKSVAIQIRPDGQVIVRAPYGCPRSFINSFIHQKADWIVKHSAENKQRYEKQVQLKKDRPTLSDAQRKRYIETARSWGCCLPNTYWRWCSVVQKYLKFLHGFLLHWLCCSPLLSSLYV